jgi:transposase-like protein
LAETVLKVGAAGGDTSAHVSLPCTVWYDATMVDCPITDLRDDRICLIWLARYLHPDGLKCPPCGHPERRLLRPPQRCPAYRGRACDSDDTLLTGTAFAKTRPRPAPLVLLLRGMATGEPTARLARALELSRTPAHTRRQRVHTHLNDTAPTGLMTGPPCEADAR